VKEEDETMIDVAKFTKPEWRELPILVRNRSEEFWEEYKDVKATIGILLAFSLGSLSASLFSLLFCMWNLVSLLYLVFGGVLTPFFSICWISYRKKFVVEWEQFAFEWKRWLHQGEEAMSSIAEMGDGYWRRVE